MDRSGQVEGRGRRFISLGQGVLFVSVLLLVVFGSYYISRSGGWGLIGFLGLPQEDLPYYKERQSAADLSTASRKLDEFQTSTVERLQISFSEDELNALIGDYFLSSKLAAKKDTPGKSTIEYYGLEGFTSGLGQVSKGLLLFVDIEEDICRLYTSFNDGKTWFVLDLRSGARAEIDIEIVRIRSRIPGFLIGRIISNLNEGIYDAIFDYQEKKITGRKITSFEIKNSTVILEGER